MPIRKSTGQQRIQALNTWNATEARIPGMDQPTYVDILTHVLEEQDRRGFWTEPGREWKVVMTAVVLKALAALRFQPDDHWPCKGSHIGGIDIAIRFLTDDILGKGGGPEAIGEDYWDACQAALALAEFNQHSTARQMLERINGDWENLYDHACKTAEGTRWCGPAYLAAMIDVIGRYEQQLGGQSRFVEALSKLQSLEERKADDDTGAFRAIAPRDDMDLWTTGLVLRTLSTVPKRHERLVDRSQVQRLTLWLLAQLNDKKHAWRHDDGEAPMLLSRSLHGLLTARPWVDSQTRDRIDQTVEWGHEFLAGSFTHKPDRHGDLKAYTAVIEYLADWKILVPAGLVFEAGKSLASSSVTRPEPRPRDGGLRIVWLSDLHVGADAPLAAPSLNLLKRLAKKFMWFKGTPLTQHFQLRNLGTILRRVGELKPDHILVTGDLTNYAQQSQFGSVKDQFVVVQSEIGSAGGTAATLSRGQLDHRLWTILPGNHDVTYEKAGDGPVRPNLGMFFESFSRAYYPEPPARSYDRAFPVVKEELVSLTARNREISIRIVGLDSTVSAPVWEVGINARGRIDRDQMSRLAELLSKEVAADMTLVALHHHPIVVPELISELQDCFLSLDEADGRALVQLCANTGVTAILHGHFHRFSSWSGLTPQRKQMSIIGSAAGTLIVPGSDEEFLELREADHETPLGVQQGLALYKHLHQTDENWVEIYTGIFLATRSRPAAR